MMGGSELIVAEDPSPTMEDIFYGLNLKGRQISTALRRLPERSQRLPRSEVIIDKGHEGDAQAD